MAYFRCEKSTKILKKLLWTNPSPTTAFSAQTISLDLSKYDGVIIKCAWFITDLQLQYQLFNYVPKDSIAHNIASFLDYSTTNFYRGRFATVTDNGVTFSNAGYPISTLANTDNRYVIPTEIYGYVYAPDMAIAEKKLLWNNPSPTAVFSAQTLNLDLSECDGVIIRCSWERTQNSDAHKALQIFNYIPKDNVSHNISSCTGTTAQIYVAKRQATVTNNGITFSDATYGSGTNSSYIIPIEIYGYIYKEKIDEPDRRKFILKDGVFQGTQGTDYGVLGTLTQGSGFVTTSSGYGAGVAPFISAEDKTKYKRVVFDVDNTSNASRMYYSTTETGSRTYINNQQSAVNLSSLNDNIFLYLTPSTTMNYYNIYLE